MLNLYYEMSGLYPEERDYVLKQLELIKDNIYNDLVIEYSMLKRVPNSIWIDEDIEDDNVALELFRLLKEIKVPNILTEYDDYIPLEDRLAPTVEFKLHGLREFEDYNTDKGMDYFK